MKLYLIGLPGSGKSFLGKQLAHEAKVSFIDLDEVIEQETGQKVSSIFLEKGEDYFRKLESVALRQQSKKNEFVMACGGGTPCFHDGMEFINSAGISVYLDIPIYNLVDRLKGERKSRPLLANHDQHSLEHKLHDLLRERKDVYQQASLRVGENISAKEILNQVLKT